MSEYDDLMERLWNSDEASALTNQAARAIQSLQEQVRELERYKQIQQMSATATLNPERLKYVRALVAQSNPATKEMAEQIIELVLNTAREARNAAFDEAAAEVACKPMRIAGQTETNVRLSFASAIRALKKEG